jgi:hypothetical protein
MDAPLLAWSLLLQTKIDSLHTSYLDTAYSASQNISS